MHKLHIDKKKVEIYLKVIVLLFIKKKIYNQTLSCCVSKSMVLLKMTKCSLLLLSLLLLLLCLYINNINPMLKFKNILLSLPIPSFSVVLDIYI